MVISFELLVGVVICNWASKIVFVSVLKDRCLNRCATDYGLSTCANYQYKNCIITFTYHSPSNIAEVILFCLEVFFVSPILEWIEIVSCFEVKQLGALMQSIVGLAPDFSPCVQVMWDERYWLDPEVAHNKENAILINHICNDDLGCFSDIFENPHSTERTDFRFDFSWEKTWVDRWWIFENLCFIMFYPFSGHVFYSSIRNYWECRVRFLDSLFLYSFDIAKLKGGWLSLVFFRKRNVILFVW